MKRVKLGYIYILIVTVSFVTTYFFLKKSILLFDDGFFPFNPLLTLKRDLSLFNYPFLLGGAYFYTYNYIPFTLLSIVLINILHLPFWVDDYLYISILQAVGSIGITRLLYKLNREKNIKDKYVIIGLFLPSLFFMFNFIKVVAINEFYPFLISFELTPLFISSIGDLFFSAKVQIKHIIFLYLLMLLISPGLYEATLAAIFLATVSVFVIYYFIFVQLETKNKLIRLAILVFIILLSVAWILPALIYNTQLGFSSAPATTNGSSSLLYELNFNRHITLFSLFTFYYWPTIFHTNSFGSELSYVLKSANEIYFYITIFTFACSQLFIMFRKGPHVTKIVFFDLVIFALTSTYLVNWPTYFLLNHYIFGLIFSFSISWEYYLLQIIFSVIFGLTILSFGRETNSYSSKNKPNTNLHFPQRTKTSLNLIGVSLIILALSLYCLPIAAFPGYVASIGTEIFTSTWRPSSAFLKVGQLLSADSGKGNVLILPILIGGASSISNTTRYLVVNQPFFTFTDSYIEYRDRAGATNLLTYPIIQEFPNNDKNFINYLRLFGISIVIIDLNTSANGYYIIGSPEAPPFNFTGMEEYFNTTPGSTFIAKYDNYILYAINKTNPLIYASNGYSQKEIDPSNSTLVLYRIYTQPLLNYSNDSLISSVDTNVTGVNSSDVRISWKQLWPDKYDITINAKHPFYLNFLKGYSGMWVMIINNSQINKMHYVSNLFANAWYMPSGNYSAIIYFQPLFRQYLAYFVSFFPIVVLLILFYTFDYNKKRKV